jgi:ABC-type oligopeptide transport system substrate-binding subunit
MDVANKSSDPSVRMAAMHEAEMLAVNEEYVCIPIYYYSNQSAVNPGLKDFTLYPTGERMFHYAYFE